LLIGRNELNAVYVFPVGSGATTNQLIVGPLVWAYQVLRQTLGERFMEDFQVRIFVHHFFTNEIALSAPERA
jgi:hypothetical protein